MIQFLLKSEINIFGKNRFYPINPSINLIHVQSPFSLASCGKIHFEDHKDKRK